MVLATAGKGNASRPAALAEMIRASASSLDLHEDWGTTRAESDCCLAVADRFDIRVMIHTDTLNESGFVEDTMAAFKGRTIHAFHTKGAGGGHAPDVIRVAGLPNVTPSSTNPTRRFTVNIIDEHLDMLMVCHHLDPNIPKDVAFAESRIRRETIAAEDIPHDMGAFSIVSSDSQAIGLLGEVLIRPFRTADKMKRQRGRLPEERGENDKFRVRRYFAKVPINPAIAQGVSHVVGSVEVGKLSDLCLWNPAFFAIKPDLVIKGGSIVRAAMGDPNASIATSQPVHNQPRFAVYGRAIGVHCVTFLSKAAIEKGGGRAAWAPPHVALVENTRGGIGKRSMVLNDATPNLEVDPRGRRGEGGRRVAHLQTCHRTADGAALLPLLTIRRATVILPAGSWQGEADDAVLLDHDRRHRRRIRLATLGGAAVLLDLARTRRLREGDALVCEDGTRIVVRAAPEPQLEITAHDTASLVLIAWHLGNRHLPKQSLGDRLRIRDDHVIAEMVRGLGGTVRSVSAPSTQREAPMTAGATTITVTRRTTRRRARRSRGTMAAVAEAPLSPAPRGG